MKFSPTSRIAGALLVSLLFAGCGLHIRAISKAGDSLPVLVEPHLISKGSSTFACVINSAAGSVVECWGANTYGMLGNGTTTDSATPVVVTGITGAVALTGGDVHTCAILADRTVYCWGYNGVSALGDGTTTDRWTPVQAQGLTDVVQIDSSDHFTCALKSDGTVACWGSNSSGQVGNGTTTTQSTPMVVAGLSGVKRIAVGSASVCAIDAAGSASCWGNNGMGLLGDGTSTNSSVPIAMTTTSNLFTLGMSSKVACGVRNDAGGTGQCWGQAAWLGGGAGNVGATAFPGFDGAVAFSGGYRHVCALMNDATVKCMGYNNRGQLGDGNIAGTISATPTAVVGLPANIAEVQAYEDGTCARTSAGAVYCWGRLNSFTGSVATPTLVAL